VKRKAFTPWSDCRSRRWMRRAFTFTPIRLGSWNLNLFGRQAGSKNFAGSSPITAHGVRAFSVPVASSTKADMVSEVFDKLSETAPHGNV
jgi:hypothetical protein